MNSDKKTASEMTGAPQPVAANKFAAFGAGLGGFGSALKKKAEEAAAAAAAGAQQLQQQNAAAKATAEQQPVQKVDGVPPPQPPAQTFGASLGGFGSALKKKADEVAAAAQQLQQQNTAAKATTDSAAATTGFRSPVDEATGEKQQQPAKGVGVGGAISGLSGAFGLGGGKDAAGSKDPVIATPPPKKAAISAKASDDVTREELIDICSKLSKKVRFLTAANKKNVAAEANTRELARAATEERDAVLAALQASEARNMKAEEQLDKARMRVEVSSQSPEGSVAGNDLDEGEAHLAEIQAITAQCNETMAKLAESEERHLAEVKAERMDKTSLREKLQAKMEEMAESRVAEVRTEMERDHAVRLEEMERERSAELARAREEAVEEAKRSTKEEASAAAGLVRKESDVKMESVIKSYETRISELTRSQEESFAVERESITSRCRLQLEEKETLLSMLRNQLNHLSDTQEENRMRYEETLKAGEEKCADLQKQLDSITVKHGDELSVQESQRAKESEELLAVHAAELRRITELNDAVVAGEKERCNELLAKLRDDHKKVAEGSKKDNAMELQEMRRVLASVEEAHRKEAQHLKTELSGKLSKQLAEAQESFSVKLDAQKAETERIIPELKVEHNKILRSQKFDFEKKMNNLQLQKEKDFDSEKNLILKEKDEMERKLLENTEKRHVVEQELLIVKEEASNTEKVMLNKFSKQLAEANESFSSDLEAQKSQVERTISKLNVEHDEIIRSLNSDHEEEVNNLQLQKEKDFESEKNLILKEKEEMKKKLLKDHNSNLVEERSEMEERLSKVRNEACNREKSLEQKFTNDLQRIKAEAAIAASSASEHGESEVVTSLQSQLKEVLAEKKKIETAAKEQAELVEEKNGAIGSLEREILHAKNNRTKTSEEAEQLKEQNGRDIAALEKDLELLRSKCNSLKDFLGLEQEQKKKTLALGKEQEKLVEEKDVAIDVLKKELRQAKNSCTKMLEEIEQLKEHNGRDAAAQKKDLESVRSSCDSLKKCLEAEQKHRKNLERENIVLKSDGSRILELQKESELIKENLKSEGQILQNSVQNLKAEVTKMNSALKEARLQKDKIDQAFDDLKEDHRLQLLESRNDSNSTVESLRSEKGDLQNVVKDLETKLDCMGKSLESAREHVCELEQKNNDLGEHMKSSNAQLEECVKKLTNELDKARVLSQSETKGREGASEEYMKKMSELRTECEGKVSLLEEQLNSCKEKHGEEIIQLANDKKYKISVLKKSLQKAMAENTQIFQDRLDEAEKEHASILREKEAFFEEAMLNEKKKLELALSDETSSSQLKIESFKIKSKKRLENTVQRFQQEHEDKIKAMESSHYVTVNEMKMECEAKLSSKDNTFSQKLHQLKTDNTNKQASDINYLKKNHNNELAEFQASFKKEKESIRNGYSSELSQMKSNHSLELKNILTDIAEKKSAEISNLKKLHGQELAKLNQDASKAIAALKNSIMVLQTEKDFSSSLRDDLLSTQESLETKNSSLEKKIEEQTDKLSALNMSLEASVDGNQKSSRDIADLREQVASLTSKHVARETLIGRLQDERDASERKHGQHTALIGMLEAQVAEAREANEKANTSLVKKEELLKKIQKDAKCLEAARAEADKESEKLRQELADFAKKMSIEIDGVRKEMLMQQRNEMDALKQFYGKKSAAGQKILEMRERECAELRKSLAAVKRELELGSPEDRQFFEMAAKQSNRDAMVAQEIDERDKVLKNLTDILSKRDADIAALTNDLRTAQSQVSKMGHLRRREDVNLDYLKSVVVKYLSYPNESSERSSLLNVLATLLQFEKADYDAINTGTKKGNWSW
eukprot:CAMPEP_0194320544 /NCGR_PEP_ID=MMETSP0171-20130528/16846_1 /TAXON_ID=218684 /ORGANISM="Corethron pennatum, Strain L29A3" /LENGTH=1829 /DNA_ID=CAMNT_0039078109 /DNA_START=206 /DNA_END=5692 /DNA_ORIENTATION=+